LHGSSSTRFAQQLRRRRQRALGRTIVVDAAQIAVVADDDVRRHFEQRLELARLHLSGAMARLSALTSRATPMTPSTRPAAPRSGWSSIAKIDRLAVLVGHAGKANVEPALLAG